MKLPTIPSHWSWKTVSNLGGAGRPAVKAGPFGSALKKSFYVQSGFRVYGQEQVIAGDLSVGNYYIDKEKFESLRACEVKAGDILVSLVGTFGKVLVVPDVFEPGIINPRLVRLSLDPNLIDPYFFSRFFRSPLAQTQMELQSHGGTMDILNAKNISELFVPLPTLEEQRRIAVILDKADAVRRKRKEAIALTEELLRSAFLEMFGDPVTNPKGWEVRPLIQLIDPKRPITYGILKPGPDTPSGIPYVRVVEMKNSTVDSSIVRRTTPEIAKQYSRSTLISGDLLLSIRGHVGRLAITPSDLNGANITQDTARLAVGNLLTTEFLFALLDSHQMQNWMKQRMKGAGVQGINLGDIKEIPTPIPSMLLQEKFSAIFRRIRVQQERNRDREYNMNNLFNSLLQRAFRGEL